MTLDKEDIATAKGMSKVLRLSGKDELVVVGMLLDALLKEREAAHPKAEEFWQHNCPEEGQIGIEKGRACDWCGVTELKREWFWLTDDEKKNIFLKWYGKHWAYTQQIKSVMDSVEDKLKEKNT